jgi:hypothetical protein
MSARCAIYLFVDVDSESDMESPSEQDRTVSNYVTEPNNTIGAISPYMADTCNSRYGVGSRLQLRDVENQLHQFALRSEALWQEIQSGVNSVQDNNCAIQQVHRQLMLKQVGYYDRHHLTSLDAAASHRIKPRSRLQGLNPYFMTFNLNSRCSRIAICHKCGRMPVCPVAIQS